MIPTNEEIKIAKDVLYRLINLESKDWFQYSELKAMHNAYEALDSILHYVQKEVK